MIRLTLIEVCVTGAYMLQSGQGDDELLQDARFDRAGGEGAFLVNRYESMSSW